MPSVAGVALDLQVREENTSKNTTTPAASRSISAARPLPLYSEGPAADVTSMASSPLIDMGDEISHG